VGRTYKKKGGEKRFVSFVQTPRYAQNRYVIAEGTPREGGGEKETFRNKGSQKKKKDLSNAFGIRPFRRPYVDEGLGEGVLLEGRMDRKILVLRIVCMCEITPAQAVTTPPEEKKKSPRMKGVVWSACWSVIGQMKTKGNVLKYG